MIRIPSWVTPCVLALALCSQACGKGRSERRPSAAADVPANDVRRLPPERKAVVPDVMLQAADRGRSLGADSAPVLLLVVSDAQCAACQRWFTDEWPAIRAQYVDSGRVRIVYVNYPLRENRNAVASANALMCASAQGQFWIALPRVFERQSAWATASVPGAMLDSLVSVPGTDPVRLRECTASGRMLRQIRADIDWADSVGVGPLPVVVVGTHMVPANAAAIREAISALLSAR